MVSWKGLDSQGFADLLSSLVFHTSITCDDNDDDNPKKFWTDMQDKLWEDIQVFFRVLDSIWLCSVCYDL